jgi:pyridoxal 5'-phosphate synthase pdxT subunit
MNKNSKLTIGVLAVQGAITEHVSAITRACENLKIASNICLVKHPLDLAKTAGLLLPGGESTTISRLLRKTGLQDAIEKRIAKHSLPILGTCAGMILLAKRLIDNTKDLQSLNAIDMEVSRNAFGRQKESFEQLIEFDGFTTPYNAVFIRAPMVTKIWSNCKILAKLDGKVIAVQQNEFLALAFHPELTDDTRIHEYFLHMLYSM